MLAAVFERPGVPGGTAEALVAALKHPFAGSRPLAAMIDALLAVEGDASKEGRGGGCVAHFPV